MSKKDALDLKRALEGAGYPVEMARNGHYRVTDPGNGRSVSFASTPSDHRSTTAALMQLRRTGFAFDFRGRTYNPGDVLPDDQPNITIDSDTTTSPGEDTMTKQEKRELILEWIAEHDAATNGKVFTVVEILENIPGLDSDEVRGALSSFVNELLVTRHPHGGYVVSRTEPETKPDLTEAAEKARTGAFGGIFAWMERQTEPFTLPEVVDGLGDGTTNKKVSNSTRPLSKAGLIERAGDRLWRYIGPAPEPRGTDTPPVVAEPQPEPTPEPAPEPVQVVEPVEVVAEPQPEPTPEPEPKQETIVHKMPEPAAPEPISDTEILEVLDMLLPNGFRATEYPLVSAWIEATRELVNKVGRR